MCVVGRVVFAVDVNQPKIAPATTPKARPDRLQARKGVPTSLTLSATGAYLMSGALRTPRLLAGAPAARTVPGTAARGQCVSQATPSPESGVLHQQLESS